MLKHFKAPADLFGVKKTTKTEEARHTKARKFLFSSIETAVRDAIVEDESLTSELVEELRGQDDAERGDQEEQMDDES